MAVARRDDFGSLLEPGLRKIFYEVYGEIPSMIGELFNVQTTDNPFEEDQSIGSLGDFPQFSGTVEYDRPYQGYNKVYEFPEFAKGFRVERKLYDDDKYNIINKKPAGLATAAIRRRETDGAAVFINAFNALFPGPDAVALCSTTHPSRAFVESGGTEGVLARSNMGVLPLTHANLQTTKNLMKGTQDDRGNRIAMKPDTLLVPTALEEVAWELIQSAGKVNTSDNNPNIHQGKYKLIVWDELTDDEDWFLIDSRYAKMFLNWFDRIPIEFAQAEDFDTLVAKYRAYMRYDCGWSDWVWIYGNHPA
jgi:hypothetical protein